MPQTKLLACAATAIIDKNTNSLSLMEVIESVESPMFPVGLPKMAVVWVKEKEEGDSEKDDYTLEMVIAGAEKRSYPLHVDYHGARMHRSVLMFVGLQIDKPGEIEIRILHGKKRVASHSVPTVLLGGTQIQQGPPPSPAPKSAVKRLTRSKPARA